MSRPPVVSEREWRAASAALLAKEKKLTRELDTLAAERRRLPMVPLDTGKYRFTAPDGSVTDLAGLFGGHRQLVIYHFMLGPGQDWLCPGCCTFTDNLAGQSQAHLTARDTRLILMARAPQQEIAALRDRMGWTVPFYSSHGSSFEDDLGVEYFGISVLLRDGGEVFRSYFTTARGVDRLRLDMNLLDLTPYGRQEEWEDSPTGWPQDPTMSWLKPHAEPVRLVVMHERLGGQLGQRHVVQAREPVLGCGDDHDLLPAEQLSVLIGPGRPRPDGEVGFTGPQHVQHPVRAAVLLQVQLNVGKPAPPGAQHGDQNPRRHRLGAGDPDVAAGPGGHPAAVGAKNSRR
jgi:predicted dithiol-disulfide oxidoreductase (DUF899 family)